MTFSTLQHYMTEVKSDIELRFAGASTEERQELINKRAIEYDVSVERVLIVDFEDMFNDSWMRKDRQNIFELLILIDTGKDVHCRNVSFGTYVHNGSRYPKVIIHGDYLDIKDSDERLWINDETAYFLGKELDLNFDYEFVEFLRVKQ
jgi:hypothetical protein